MMRNFDNWKKKTMLFIHLHSRKKKLKKVLKYDKIALKSTLYCFIMYLHAKWLKKALKIAKKSRFFGRCRRLWPRTRMRTPKVDFSFNCGHFDISHVNIWRRFLLIFTSRKYITYNGMFAVNISWMWKSQYLPRIVAADVSQGSRNKSLLYYTWKLKFSLIHFI